MSLNIVNHDFDFQIGELVQVNYWDEVLGRTYSLLGLINAMTPSGNYYIELLNLDTLQEYLSHTREEFVGRSKVDYPMMEIL